MYLNRAENVIVVAVNPPWDASSINPSAENPPLIDQNRLAIPHVQSGITGERAAPERNSFAIKALRHGESPDGWGNPRFLSCNLTPNRHIMSLEYRVAPAADCVVYR